MRHIKIIGLIAVLALIGSAPAMAGQGPASPKPDGAKTDDQAAPKPDGAKTTDQAAPPVTSVGVIQFRKQLTGDFSYRFVSLSGKAGASVTAPVQLPTPSAADNIVAIPIPSTVNLKDAQLEVLDNGRSNIA